MTDHPEFYLQQTGRCDLGDGRGTISYRLLSDGPSLRDMIRREEEIVALIQQLPEGLAQGFAEQLKAMLVQGHVGAPVFVREDETAGPTFNRIFRWAEVAELADFEIALRAAVARLHDENSTVGCDKASVGVPGRGVDCAGEVTS